MRIYAKRKTKNKIKQVIQKALYTVLVLIGFFYLLNCGMDYISNVQWFVPKTITIFNRGIDSAGPESEAGLIVPIEKLSVITTNAESERLASSSPASLPDKIRQVFGEYGDEMIATAKAESRLNPYAIHKNTNGTTDCGVLQINVPGDGCPPELFDVDNNLAKGKEMFDRRGFTPWVAHNTGAYLAYLK